MSRVCDFKFYFKGSSFLTLLENTVQVKSIQLKNYLQIIYGFGFPGCTGSFCTFYKNDFKNRYSPKFSSNYFVQSDIYYTAQNKYETKIYV